MQISSTLSMYLGALQCHFGSAVVAGGALRDMLMHKPVKDYDIFIPSRPVFADPDDELLYDRAEFLRSIFPKMKTICGEGFLRYAGGRFADVVAIYDTKDDIDGCPIQIIAVNTPVTPAIMMERIDFGLCRVVHDGNFCHIHPDFYHDSTSRVFTLRRSENQQQFDRSMERFRRLREKYPDFALSIPEKFSNFGSAVL